MPRFIRCGDCDFYQEGCCHRNAPAHGKIILENAPAVWPSVRADEGCGDGKQLDCEKQWAKRADAGNAQEEST